MVKAIPVIIYAVFSFTVTVLMTIDYCRHYRTINMGYPIAILVIFSILILMNIFPLPEILGPDFIEFWRNVTNGGYIVQEYHDWLTPLGLFLLTLKLYCTANVIVGAVYWIVYLIRKHNAPIDNSKEIKEAAELNRKGNTEKRDDLPCVGDDFSFVTDTMPVNGILTIDGIRIEILNNSGKRIPEGKKRIFARRIKDHQQLDSKTTDMQPEGDIPFIEIWAIESIE